MTMPERGQGRLDGQPPAGQVPDRCCLLPGGYVVTPHGVLSNGGQSATHSDADALLATCQAV